MKNTGSGGKHLGRWNTQGLAENTGSKCKTRRSGPRDTGPRERKTRGLVKNKGSGQ